MEENLRILNFMWRLANSSASHASAIGTRVR